MEEDEEAEARHGDRWCWGETNTSTPSVWVLPEWGAA